MCVLYWRYCSYYPYWATAFLSALHAAARRAKPLSCAIYEALNTTSSSSFIRTRSPSTNSYRAR
jgi:hypothetical protein